MTTIERSTWTTKVGLARMLSGGGRHSIPSSGPRAAKDDARDPVGAENPVTSCDLQILVEKAAELVSS